MGAWAVRVATGAGLALLIGLAVRADLAAFAGEPSLVVADILVGLAYVTAALVATGPRAQRFAVGAVGPAWLLGSLLPVGSTAHQAMLAIALIAFPGGRIRGASRWVGAAVAVIAAIVAGPQIWTATMFATVALIVAAGRRTARNYPMASAGAVAAVLGVSWWLSRHRADAYDPTTALLVYEAALLAVAAAFPLATRSVERGHARLADRVLADRGLVGLEGLGAVLGAALGDPTLRVDRRSSPVDAPGWLTVHGPDGPIAAISARPSTLDDPRTATAAAAAVRLAVTNLVLLEEQEARLAELEASRARLVAAADRQRIRAATELRAGADAPLRSARSSVTAVRAAAHDEELAATLDVVVAELVTAAREIDDLVAGVPPAGLGGGGLPDALDELARLCPLPVAVTVASDAAGGRDAETALYYVAAEALANAVKHAEATTIDITVRRDGALLVATFTDDGVGGADTGGSGLIGLADRLAAQGGRLRVDSPPGAGTTLSATVVR